MEGFGVPAESPGAGWTKGLETLFKRHPTAKTYPALRWNSAGIQAFIPRALAAQPYSGFWHSLKVPSFAYWASASAGALLRFKVSTEARSIRPR